MNLKSPKISFIVPVYNKQAYIANCLDSLLNQSLKEIEIVVVDDKSTDDSLDVINYYKDKDNRVIVYPLPKNMGRSYARNFGNEKARSSILCVQDADDLAYRERAKLILNKFQKEPGLDMVYSGFYISAMDGNPIEEIKAIPFDIENVKKNKVTYIGHSTMAYKKAAILKIKYSDGKWSKLGLDDWKLQLDMYSAGMKFGFIDKPLMIYRQTDNSISRVRSATAVYRQKGSYLKYI